MCKELLIFSENSLKDTLQFVNNLEEGVEIYRKIYKKKQKYRLWGIVSIELEVINYSLFIIIIHYYSLLFIIIYHRL